MGTALLPIVGILALLTAGFLYCLRLPLVSPRFLTIGHAGTSTALIVTTLLGRASATTDAFDATSLIVGGVAFVVFTVIPLAVAKVLLREKAKPAETVAEGIVRAKLTLVAPPVNDQDDEAPAPRRLRLVASTDR